MLILLSAHQPSAINSTINTNNLWFLVGLLVEKLSPAWLNFPIVKQLIPARSLDVTPNWISTTARTPETWRHHYLTRQDVSSIIRKQHYSNNETRLEASASCGCLRATSISRLLRYGVQIQERFLPQHLWTLRRHGRSRRG